MKTIETSIRLTFRTNDGKPINITIPRADKTVTGPEVRTAMERILATNIVVTAAGQPETIDKAELIMTEELVYPL